MHNDLHAALLFHADYDRAGQDAVPSEIRTQNVGCAAVCERYNMGHQEMLLYSQVSMDIRCKQSSYGTAASRTHDVSESIGTGFEPRSGTSRVITTTLDDPPRLKFQINATVYIGCTLLPYASPRLHCSTRPESLLERSVNQCEPLQPELPEDIAMKASASNTWIKPSVR